MAKTQSEVNDEGNHGNDPGRGRGRHEAGRAARTAGSDQRPHCSGSCDARLHAKRRRYPGCPRHAGLLPQWQVRRHVLRIAPSARRSAGGPGAGQGPIEDMKAMDTQGSAAILLVEDNQVVRLVTIGMLRDLGYVNITAAVNGEEAVKACARSRFDLILMDCDMPVLNGLDATRQIRAAGVRTPVIAYTASITSANRSRCAEAGMDDFLPKPSHPG